MASDQFNTSIIDSAVFIRDEEWANLVIKCAAPSLEPMFNYIVVGTGFCGLAVVEQLLVGNPHARILVLEAGTFVLPDHFQNASQCYQTILGQASKDFRWYEQSPMMSSSDAASVTSATASETAYRGTTKEYLSETPVHQQSSSSRCPRCESGATSNAESKWTNGVQPMFGGRSLVWNAWCPRPTPDEMSHWPKLVIDAAQKYFDSAERLLGVISADRIDQTLDNNPLSSEVLDYISNTRPIFGELQRSLQEMLKNNLSRVENATHVGPTPMAIGSRRRADGVQFAKYSTPGKFVELYKRQAKLYAQGRGSKLTMVCRCCLKELEHKDGNVTALQTSRGRLVVGSGTEVILAMGTAPTTELVLRSFPDLIKPASARVAGHFMTSVVARVPRNHFNFSEPIRDLEMAMIYLAGKDPNSGMQFHFQLSSIADRDPRKNAQNSSRYMPYILAADDNPILINSEDYVVFACKVLGELNAHNPSNNMWLKTSSKETLYDNAIALNIEPSEIDNQTWDCMMEAAFQMVERVLSSDRKGVQYWHGKADAGEWKTDSRPPVIPKTERRMRGLVHDSSTLWIGKDKSEGVVGLDYRLNGISNVRITGGALFPTSGSWNPTLTMVALCQDLADKLTAEAEAMEE